MTRIVYNRLLRGWYIVRGPHQTPLGGRFESRAAAMEHLQQQSQARAKVRWSVKISVPVGTEGWMVGTHNFASKAAALEFIVRWRKAEGNDNADASATLLRNGMVVPARRWGQS